MKKEEEKVEDEEVILIKPYKVSMMTSSSSKTRFITDEVKNLIRYIKFVQSLIQTRLFKLLLHYQSVVATTRWNGTCSMLTSAKFTEGYLVVGITRELDKEPSLHCSSIYINTTWSMLQQYLPALISMPLPHVLLLRPPCYMYVL